jgi:tRNA(fMet)-specific endonuclease VapC
MSTKYMLDTDTVSFIIKRNPVVVETFRRVGPENTCISVVTEAEQLVGLQRMTEGSGLYRATFQFLEAARIVAWSSLAAAEFAPIYYYLRRSRQHIGDLDVMIAAHALSLGATLVTNNIRHHQRVPGALKLENWLTS